MKIVVLGAGRVGGAIVRDLSSEGSFSLSVVDLDPLALERLEGFGVTSSLADLSNPDGVAEAVDGADLVVGAVPGFMGYQTVEVVLEQGKPVVDISFFAEDAYGLDGLARDKGVPCLVDCGVAPGLTNLILGRLEEALEETHSFRAYIGGLPVERAWPWEYKAPFSPRDVIQEYVRPARLRRNGQALTLPALSEVELVDFPGLGTLEAFNTDGLRSLLDTCRTPDMVEKTIRYPGHAEKMRMLRDAGFFEDREILAPSGMVRPRDVTETLLFDAWQFEEGEPDLTVGRFTVEGRQNGKHVRHTYNLLDYYNPETETSSMARTTGYTCAAMVRLVAGGMWTEPGVAAPEVVGRRADCFEFVLEHLKSRRVGLFHHLEEL
ncbi:MAG: saccharopine dehydrogenase NADP-binding domain-containing protein, partial [Gemmatimonadetes bacterium]|nr:saccharopine dehydrogenase NADP-binding domain-containing protein [Gemmatimonadota bacterium]